MSIGDAKWAIETSGLLSVRLLTPVQRAMCALALLKVRVRLTTPSDP
jgi:hypothetical protein